MILGERTANVKLNAYSFLLCQNILASRFKLWFKAHSDQFSLHSINWKKVWRTSTGTHCLYWSAYAFNWKVQSTMQTQYELPSARFKLRHEVLWYTTLHIILSVRLKLIWWYETFYLSQPVRIHNDKKIKFSTQCSDNACVCCFTHNLSSKSHMQTALSITGKLINSNFFSFVQSRIYNRIPRLYLSTNAELRVEQRLVLGSMHAILSQSRF